MKSVKLHCFGSCRRILILELVNVLHEAGWGRDDVLCTLMQLRRKAGFG